MPRKEPQSPGSKTVSTATQTPTPFEQTPRSFANALNTVQRRLHQIRPADVALLQRTIGNRAVGRLLQTTTPPHNTAPIQGKFKIAQKEIVHPGMGGIGERRETIDLFVDEDTGNEYQFVNKGMNSTLGNFYVVKRISDGHIVQVSATTWEPIFEDKDSRAIRLNNVEMDMEGLYETEVDDESPIPDDDKVEFTDIEIEKKSKIKQEPKQKKKKAKKLLTNEEIRERVERKLQTDFTVQVALVPDSEGATSDPSSGLKGERKYKSAQLWVEDLQIGDQDRPDTRFDTQKSHTVAWTLLRAEIASLRGLPLVTVLKIMFTRLSELNHLAEALKIAYDIESKRGKSESAVNKVENVMIETLSVQLGQAGSIAKEMLMGDATAPLYYWQSTTARLIRLFTQVYQLSKGATMRDGTATGDAEADGMAKLRKHELALRTTGDYGDPIQPKNELPLVGGPRTKAAITEIIIAAERLLDVNFKASLPAQGYAHAIHHWIQALHLTFPSVMTKVGGLVLKTNLEAAPKGEAAKTGAPTVGALLTHFGYGKVEETVNQSLAIANAPRLKSSDSGSLRIAVPPAIKSSFTANVAVAPGSVGVSSVVQPPQLPNQSPTVTPTTSKTVLPGDEVRAVPMPFYTPNQVGIYQLTVSDLDRPDTRYGGDQKSHTVAWTLARAQLRSYQGGPVLNLLNMIKDDLDSIKNFVKHEQGSQLLRATHTQLTQVVGQAHPIHAWQVLASDVVRRYMIIYQLSHTATFADSSTLGAAWGKGEAQHMEVLRNNEANLSTNGKWVNSPQRILEAGAKLVDIHPDSALSKQAALKAFQHWEAAMKDSFPTIMAQQGPALKQFALDRQLEDKLFKQHGFRTLRAWLGL
jgi:hypothetical protein